MIRREDCVKIGEVGKPHHLQGALVVHTEEDLLGLQPTEPVFLLLEGAPVPFYFSENGIRRRNSSSFIVKFDFVDSKEQAERLTGSELLYPEELLEDVEDEEFDLYDLIGFDALDLFSQTTGKVTDVVDYSGNIVLTIQIFSKEILLPLAEHYVKEILPEENIIHVEIPEDLKELY